MDKLGEGGAAVVWRTQLQSHDLIVAVKHFNKDEPSAEAELKLQQTLFPGSVGNYDYTI